MFPTVRYVFLASYCAMLGLGLTLLATGVASWDQVKYPVVIGSAGWVGSTIHLIILQRHRASRG